MRVESRLRRVPPHWDRLSPHARVPRHRHDQGHLVVVVAGAYEEAGDSGRRRLRPGAVLVQKPYVAHADAIGAQGAVLLCLPLAGFEPCADAGVIQCVDEIVRCAGIDPRVAAGRVLDEMTPFPAEMRDWPDALAAALRADAHLRLGAWGAAHGLSGSALTRGFARAFGVSPRRYRADQRALRSLRAIRATQERLCAIAMETGYADQAHMTRELRRLTGATPGVWRRK